MLGERITAGLLLLLSLPFLLFAGSVVSVLSRRSPLILHKRVGFGGRSIWVLKLRTMWDQSERHRWWFVERVYPSKTDCAIPKLFPDPRVRNAFAAFCRRFSIDELPQLWQVVVGDMALVGPRPLTCFELELHYGRYAAEVLTRKPGVSGLWQVRGRSQLTYRQRRRLDLFMVRSWSPGLYFRILAATVSAVLSGRGAW